MYMGNPATICSGKTDTFTQNKMPELLVTCSRVGYVDWHSVGRLILFGSLESSFLVLFLWLLYVPQNDGIFCTARPPPIAQTM